MGWWGVRYKIGWKNSGANPVSIEGGICDVLSWRTPSWRMNVLFWLHSHILRVPKLLCLLALGGMPWASPVSLECLSCLESDLGLLSCCCFQGAWYSEGLSSWMYAIAGHSNMVSSMCPSEFSINEYQLCAASLFWKISSWLSFLVFLVHLSLWCRIFHGSEFLSSASRITSIGITCVACHSCGCSPC